VQTMALAGLAAVAWGSSDFVAGVCARRMPIRTVLIGSKVAGLVVAVVFLLLRPAPLPSGSRLLVLAGLAGVLGVPAMGLLYRAMRDGSLTVVAPVAAGAALVPFAWGLTRGDHLGPAAMVGAVAALAGMTLASWPVRLVRPGDPAGERRSPAPVNRAAMWCAAGAALGFGAYFVLLHEAAPRDPYDATACARIAGGVTALLLSFRPPPRPRRRPSVGRPRRWTVWLLPVCAGLLDTVADGAFAVAAAAGTVGTAAVLASMYPAVTVLLNTAVLRERLHRIHLAGVLTALFAVVCLAA
jgi:drug/metabolite transporter (DMT)-like permease